MDTALSWFIALWLGLALLINLFACAGMVLGFCGLWDGWHRLIAVFDLSALDTVLYELALLLPVLAALYWQQQRRAGSGPGSP